MECLRPIDFKMKQHDCMISLEPTLHAVFIHKFKERMISDAFMSCRPRHNFFKYLIDYFSTIDKPKVKNHVSAGHIINNAFEDAASLTKRGLPYLGEEGVFQPVTDPNRADDFAKACRSLIGMGF